jgi:tubulin--tyrosine ligase like protein 10
VFADPSLDDIELNENEKVETRRVFVGKGNNSKLVSNFFQEREGYDLMAEKEQFSPNFFFKWVQSTGEIDFYSFKEGIQIVNHIPNICVITHKLDLLKTLRELEAELEQQGQKMVPSVSEFVPKTYRLDVMSDEIDFLNDTTEGVWIYKPRNLNQGRGIRLI